MPDTTIDRIDTYVVHYDVRSEAQFTFLDGMGSYPRGRTTVVVRMRGSDGEQGWGQSVPSPRWSYETVESVETTVRNYLTSELIGLSPFDESEFQQRLDRAIAPSFSRGQPICKAALEMARFDLAGRIQQQSAFECWKAAGALNGGAAKDRLTMSWTLQGDSEESLERQVAEAEERGYHHFNVKVGSDPQRDVELCRLVRRQAPDAKMWADANGHYDLDAALTVAPHLAELGFLAFEQPLAANRLGDCRKLKQLGALPIVLDEPLVTAVELQEFHRLGLLDGAVLKVARSGGVRETLRQLEYLRQENLLVLGSGLTDPDLSLAASVLLFAYADIQHPVALNGPQYLADSILQSPLVIEDDVVVAPQGPGLGVEVDRDLMRDRVID